jgi:hypothetical protein
MRRALRHPELQLIATVAHPLARRRTLEGAAREIAMRHQLPSIAMAELPAARVVFKTALNSMRGPTGSRHMCATGYKGRAWYKGRASS